MNIIERKSVSNLNSMADTSKRIVQNLMDEVTQDALKCSHSIAEDTIRNMEEHYHQFVARINRLNDIVLRELPEEMLQTPIGQLPKVADKNFNLKQAIEQCREEFLAKAFAKKEEKASVNSKSNLETINNSGSKAGVPKFEATSSGSKAYFQMKSPFVSNPALSEVPEVPEVDPPSKSNKPRKIKGIKTKNQSSKQNKDLNSSQLSGLSGSKKKPWLN